MNKSLHNRKRVVISENEFRDIWSSVRDKIRLFILLARLFPVKHLAAGEYICLSCLTFSKSNEGVVKIVHLCWNYVCLGIIAEILCGQYVPFLKEN